MCLAAALQDTELKTSTLSAKRYGVEIVLGFTDIYCNSKELKKFPN